MLMKVLVFGLALSTSTPLIGNKISIVASTSSLLMSLLWSAALDFCSKAREEYSLTFQNSIGISKGLASQQSSSTIATFKWV